MSVALAALHTPLLRPHAGNAAALRRASRSVEVHPRWQRNALAPVAAVRSGSSIEVSGRQLAAFLHSRVGRLATRLARHAVLHTLRLLVQLVRQLQLNIDRFSRQMQLQRQAPTGVDAAAARSTAAPAEPVAWPVLAEPAPKPSSVAREAAADAAESPLPAAGASGWAALVTAATTGAASLLHETLNDAAAGIGEKVSALHVSAASSMGEALFQATSASAAMMEDLAAAGGNPNPAMSGKVWRHATTQAVLSEEERLRQAVFRQVYAELCRDDGR